MEVERLDLYDFKVTLVEDDFNEIKALACLRKTSIEAVIASLLDDALDYQMNG